MIVPCYWFTRFPRRFPGTELENTQTHMYVFIKVFNALGFLWREWYWSWDSNTLATSCEVLTHWKRLWCWEGLGAGGEGDKIGWDGWMESLTRWTWVWVNSWRWWWTGRAGVLWFMGSQRVGHNWVTELNWTDALLFQSSCISLLYQQQLGRRVRLHCFFIVPINRRGNWEWKFTEVTQ